MYLFTNLAKDTLAAPLASGATSVTFTTGTMFKAPTGGDIEVLFLVDDEFEPTQYEIVYLTARTGTTGTITRVREGTTSPASWPAGTVVAARVSAAVFGTFPQLDNGGNAKGSNAVNLQSGRTSAAFVASGAQSAVVGYNGRAAAPDSFAWAGGDVSDPSAERSMAGGNGAEVAGGTDAMAVMPNSYVNGDRSFACGDYARAVGDRLQAFGPDAYIDGTTDATVVAGPICGSVLDTGDAASLAASGGTYAQFRMLSGVRGILRTDFIDLKSTGTHTMTLPPGVTFFPTEVGVYGARIDTPSGTPTVTFGTTGNNSLTLGTSNVTLTANRGINRYTTLASEAGITGALTMEVTGAGGGTFFFVRAYWEGLLVQDEGVW